MMRTFGEIGTLEEPVLSELLVLAVAPRAVADAVRFVALAAEIPLREWRNVVLPRYREVRRTPEYQSARFGLADACDGMGHAVAREVIVRRAAEVARSIEWYASKAPQHAIGLSADSATRALTAAALAVWAREQLTSEQFAALLAPFDAPTPIASPQ